RKQGHGLMVAASKYSLCGTEHEMKHIDSLSSVLISKGKLLSKFKTMVVDSFLADQIEIGDAPYHKGDRDYIGSLEALIELEKHKNKFSEAIQSNVDLKDAWSALLGIKHSLEVDSVKIFDEHKSLAKKTSTVINEIEATSQDYYKNIGMLKTALNTIDSKNTSDEQQIEAIYSERARWDDDIRISEKIADYDNLSFFIEKMDQDISHYNNL
ncbi:MAG: ATP-binding protein, partial [Paraglaciecola sp.]|nr:ATP-binding protein [Paraglaciecola sp.]